jgi:hypothetical protein
MALSKNALLLWANHTDNAFEAAVVITRLGREKYEATPKAGLPGDMVLELVTGSIEDAVFAIRNCTSSDVLDLIAQTERRYKSALAMAANPHLSEGAWAIVRARLSASQQHDADGIRFETVSVDADITEKIETFLADPRTYASETRHVNAAIDRAENLVELDNGLADRLLRTEAQHGGVDLTFSYLDNYYCAESLHWDRLWSHVTMEPEVILGLRGVGEQQTLINGLLYRISRRNVRPVEIGVVRMMMEVTQCPDHFFENATKRMLFSSEGADALITDPKWIGVLLSQDLSDEQFSVLAANCGSKELRMLVLMLNSRKSRLEIFLDKLDACDHRVELETNRYTKMLACTAQDDRDLIRRVLILGTNDLSLRYLSGAIEGRDGTAILPGEDEVIAIAERNPRIVTTHWHLLRKVVQDERLSDEYVATLIDRLPGMARLVMTENRCGPMLYAKLLGCGVNIEKALSVLDKSKTKSLVQVCETLRP